MRRFSLAILLFLFVGMLLGGWYAYHKGFTREWRNEVSEQFRQRGYEISLRRLTLDPLRGLVAKDVKIFDARDRRRTLAMIDEVLLQVNYANLARRQAFFDALELRDATVSLPVDPEKPQGTAIVLGKLNARLFLPPQQIYLARAEAEVFGMQVSASGRLINPEAFRLQNPAAERPVKFITRVVEELKALHFEKGAPVVNLTFSGDLAMPDQIVANLTLWSARLSRDRYTLDDLYMTAAYRDGSIDLKQFVASDAAGVLHLSGAFCPSTGAGNLNLRSGLDVQALATAFDVASALGEFVFHSPPMLEVAAKYAGGENPRLQLAGHVTLQKFAFKAVMFDRFSADFSWEEPRWSVRDAHLIQGAGEAKFDAMQVPDAFRARLKSSIEPVAVQPLLTGFLPPIFWEFQFPKPPAIELSISGPALAAGTLNVTGTVTFSGAYFLDQPISAGAAALEMRDGKFTCGPLRFRQDAGAPSTLSYDVSSGALRVDKVPPGAAKVDRPDVRETALQP